MKIFASDLDGTLLTSNGQFSKKTIFEINRLKEKQIPIVVASGRTDLELYDMLELLELPKETTYIISYNGAKASKLYEKTPLFSKTISAKDANEIIKLLTSYGFLLHVFSKDNIYFSEGMSHRLSHPAIKRYHVEDVNFETYEIKEDIYKILVYEDADKLEELKKKCHTSFLKKFSMINSHPHLLEFVSKDGTKGEALKYLTSLNHWNRDEIIAFGDEENDISMIEYAGTGVAMGNARENVKKAADLVTLSNDFDGLALVLEQLI